MANFKNNVCIQQLFDRSLKLCVHIRYFSWHQMMGYKWVKLLKSDRFIIFELNTSSYRVFYGLFKNHKFMAIEQKKLKL